MRLKIKAEIAPLPKYDANIETPGVPAGSGGCHRAASRLRSPLLLALALLFAGCGERPTSLDKPETPKLAGSEQTYSITPRFPHPELVEQRLKAFAARSGNSYRAVRETDAPADLHFFAAAELPRLAEAGRLMGVPDDFRAQNAPYDWGDLALPYAIRLAVWKGVPVGVPLMGEGQALVYDAARLADPTRLKEYRERFGREIRAPETWNELADDAEFFYRPEKPTLPPLPAADGGVERIFYDIAVCFDRRTRSPSDVGTAIPTAEEGEDLLAFHYDLRNYEPRIAKPAFVAALKLMQRMERCRAKGPADPVTALESGNALFGVLKLDELARLGAGRFAVAPLPGSDTTFDSRDDSPLPNRGGTINRMPYLGWGAAFAGVGRGCANPSAAFEFLADFGNPTKASLDIIAAAKYGAGPYRRSHEETRHLSRWLAYGLDRANTDQLLTALRYQNGSNAVNYRMVLRVPDEAAHTAILAEELRSALSGRATAEAALQSAARRWVELDKSQPEATRRAWIRNSLGL